MLFLSPSASLISFASRKIHLTFMNIVRVLDEIIIMRGIMFASLWQMSPYKSTSGGSPNGMLHILMSPRYSPEIFHNNLRNNFPARACNRRHYARDRAR